MARLVPARVAFDAAGVPYSPEYGDVYHSADGGPEQARHVFLGGNGLPGRWRGRGAFTIVETGFGLGVNFLVTCAALLADAHAPEHLHYVSAEKHPFEKDDLAAALARYTELAPLAGELAAAWPAAVAGVHRLKLARGRVELTLLFGDAAEMLPRVDARADAFYLDGFAPARNPELWSAGILRELARLAAPGATLATWTVARAVRERLAAAGFAVEKRPGFGRKREMLAGGITRP
jgi:tRNA 5-methylaminomethyl-2-thiouridine biosynthesis bifunctional protein